MDMQFMQCSNLFKLTAMLELIFAIDWIKYVAVRPAGRLIISEDDGRQATDEGIEMTTQCRDWNDNNDICGPMTRLTPTDSLFLPPDTLQ